MTDDNRQSLLASYVLAPTENFDLARRRLLDAAPLVRIVPDPPGASPIALARMRYQLTKQRQWIVAPTVELLN